jgi:hypothetical protein
MGVLIDTLTSGSTKFGNLYGLYQNSSGASNYFAGSVGIGTSTPSDKLTVIGRGLSTVGWVTQSDARLKKNVATLTNALARLTRLRGVSYDWRIKENPDFEFTEGRQVGLIAQEVRDVLPEAVSAGQDGYYAIDYDKIIPLLVESVKEQQAEVLEKDLRIEELETRLENLETVVTKLLPRK